MIEKAQKLLKTATIDDLDQITELLVDMVSAYTEYENITAQQELWYETTRAETYIDTKTKKKLWKTNMTEGDINHHAKLTALKKFWDYKTSRAKRNEYSKRIEMLSSKKIELLTMDKRQSTI